MSTTGNPIAVLKLPNSVPKVLKAGKALVTGIGNNPATFPSPEPARARVPGHIGDPHTPETAAKGRAKGAVQARNDKLKIVRADLRGLKGYVQRVADANPGTAASIIASASLDTRKVTARTKSDLEASSGGTSGEVRLVAKAAVGRTSYDWAYSTDQKVWTSVPSTLQASTAVHGLTPATTYWFRVRRLTRAGQADWSQMVSLLVR